MPVVNLSSTNIRTDTIGSSPPYGAILAGRDHYNTGDCAGGVQFDLPVDLSNAHFNSAVLSLQAVERNDYSSSFYVRVGVPANNTAFGSQDFKTATLHRPKLFKSNLHIIDPPPPYDEVLHNIKSPYSLDLAAMFAEAAAAGRMVDDLQIAFALHTVDDDQFEPFWAEFSAFSLSIDYEILPIRLTLPEIVRIGESRPATLHRLAADPTPLEVTLTQSPSGRLILPATVTIPADEAEEEFAIEGASLGEVTVTATAGADEHQQAIEVLSSLPLGIGGELGWWCPSLDGNGDGTGTLSDLTGYGHPGTLTGNASWETHGGSRCVSLTSGGQVLIGHFDLFDFERTDPFSLSQWLFVPTGSGTGIDLISKMQDASPNRGYAMRVNSPSATVMHLLNGYMSNDLTRQVAYTVLDPRGSWRHLAVTYDGSGTPAGVTIYWDGVARAATTATNTLNATIRSTAPLRIGARPGAGATLRFDDARVFGRELTAAEVTILALRRGVIGDGTLHGMQGPHRHRLTRHRINRGRIL